MILGHLSYINGRVAQCDVCLKQSCEMETCIYLQIAVAQQCCHSVALPRPPNQVGVDTKEMSVSFAYFTDIISPPRSVALQTNLRTLPQTQVASIMTTQTNFKSTNSPTQ